MLTSTTLPAPGTQTPRLGLVARWRSYREGVRFQRALLSDAAGHAPTSLFRRASR